MRQPLQNVSTGEVTVQEVPGPVRGASSLLVATRFSVISPGTERAVRDLGRASLVAEDAAYATIAHATFEMRDQVQGATT